MASKEMDLMSRKKATLVYAKRYRRASSKKEKSQILDEFVRLTGYNRCYASWLLRNAGKKAILKPAQALDSSLSQTPQGK